MDATISMFKRRLSISSAGSHTGKTPSSERTDAFAVEYERHHKRLRSATLIGGQEFKSFTESLTRQAGNPIMKAVYLMVQVQHMRRLEQCLLGEMARICHAAREQGLMTEKEFPESLISFYSADITLNALPQRSNLPYVDKDDLLEYVRRTVGLVALFE